MKWSIILKSYLLGISYFGIVYLFTHIKTTSGIDFNYRHLDALNALNLIFLFPVSYYFVHNFKNNKHTKRQKSFIEQSYEQNNESFAQIQYAPAWSSHGSSDVIGDFLIRYFSYLIIYIFSIFIILIPFSKYLIRKWAK